jgi:cytochrome P450
VTSITAGNPSAGETAFAALSTRLEHVMSDDRDSLLAAVAAHSELGRPEIIANAAVLLFGGIETTEGMIANAIVHLLERPEQLALVLAEHRLIDTVIEESLRLEPAAAVVDRYATADVDLGGAPIRAGDLVRLSIAGANRDPAIFNTPDQLDLTGGNGRRHLAFAHGPHVCVGVHLARLEGRTALAALIEALPGLRPDPARPSEIRGLVFRKPPTVHALWDR